MIRLGLNHNTKAVGEMTQKLVGKHYMYSSLLLLLDMGETVTSKEKKRD